MSPVDLNQRKQLAWLETDGLDLKSKAMHEFRCRTWECSGERALVLYNDCQKLTATDLTRVLVLQKLLGVCSLPCEKTPSSTL